MPRKPVKKELKMYSRLSSLQRDGIRGAVEKLIADGERNVWNLSQAVEARYSVHWPASAMYERFRRLGVPLEQRDPSRAVEEKVKSGPPRPEEVIEKRDLKAEAAELRAATTDAAKAQQIRDMLQLHLGTWTPRPYNPPPGLREDKADHLWILHLSDWHIGQNTDKDSTGGMFVQTTDIAREQVTRMSEILREIMRDGGRKVRKLLIIMNGDIVEGDDMRNSQHTDIDRLVMEQTVDAFDLSRWLIDSLQELFEEEIVISAVGGNHDRTSRKPGNAGLGELGYVDTYSWLIGEMLTRWYEKDPRTTVHNRRSFFGQISFGGHRIVHSHGADVKWTTGGHSGIPWNAISVAAMRYEQMVGGYDALFLGHGHIAAALPLGQQSHIFLNGSLPPSTGWVQASFKANRRPVQQLTMWNRHGCVAYYPIYLDVGNRAATEEIWLESPTVD